MRVNEQALAAQCAAGDERAQRLFVDQHIDYIHRVLYRIMGSSNEVEDLVQEALIEVIKSLGTFRGKASLRTWVTRITCRVAYKHLKRNKTPMVRLESVPNVGVQDARAEARLAARNAARRLYALLSELEPKQRIAFVLHAIDGRTVREVAEATGSNLIATKSRIRRTRAKLRQDPVVAAFLQEPGV